MPKEAFRSSQLLSRAPGRGAGASRWDEEGGFPQRSNGARVTPVGEHWKRARCLALIGCRGCNAKPRWERETMPNPSVGEDLAALSCEKMPGNERALNLYSLSRVERGFCNAFAAWDEKGERSAGCVRFYCLSGKQRLTTMCSLEL